MEYKIPHSVVWTITEKCNLKCTHCFIYGIDGANEELEIGTERALEIIDEFKKLKVFGISFTGGEPLARKDLDRLLFRAAQNGIVCTIATNGTYLTHEWVERFVKYKVPTVAISIDGWDKKSHDKIRGRGNFDIVLHALRELRKNGIDVNVSVAIDKDNFDKFEKMLKFFSTLDITQVKIQAISFIDRQEKKKKDKILSLNYSQLKEMGEIANKYCKIKKKGFIRFACNIGFLNHSHLSEWNVEPNPMGTCGVGTDILTLKADGTLTTCVHGYLDESLGNLKTESFEQALSKSARVLNKWYNKTEVKGICESCAVFSACKGGCRGLAALENNGFFNSDSNCKFPEI